MILYAKRERTDPQLGPDRTRWEEKTVHYFDYETMARDAGIPADKLAKIAECIRQEFP